ncbi:alpha/beta hydrolase [Sabulilitoribacter arenilitoris]|uniref:Alpha/beta hydrolase n=1 Tax=Wocania arenilitoris TaxID=2044858 RepID=A0AAE3JM37_9FLAO|nr:alpha/beta hydrolase [Wocania arenilitoris]MCF7568897.1 alpha/beta hydrolase [Wocania arenilitoris]
MVGLLLYFFQERILFLPTVLANDYEYQFDYPFEELFLKTDDKTVINAIHFKTENPKGVILYFHGNAGDLSRWGFVVEYFVEKQYDVLIMDYRTYGKSTGKLSEQALYDDADYCYDYLKTHYDESVITLYGRSLGSGIASYLASKNKPNQLILETPYYSIIDVAKSRFPMFPVEKLLKYKLPTHQYIQQVNCLVTMFQGTEDLIVPYKSAKKLFKISPKNLTTFITIQGGNHKDLNNYELYHTQIKKILP